MRRLILCLALLAAPALTGCATYYTATPAGQGKAYVVRMGALGGNMMICDATSGKPVCGEVEER
jgi:uncharacterized protein YceK